MAIAVANPATSLSHIFGLTLSSGLIGIDIRGFWNYGIGIGIAVAVGRREWAVDGSKAEPQVPGRFRVTIFPLNKIDRPIGVPISCVARDALLFPVHFNDLIIKIIACVLRVFGATPNKLVIPIASVPAIDAGMPFADLSGCVSVLPKHPWPKGTFLRIIYTAGILALHPQRRYAILVVPGQHGRPRGHAPGGNVGVRETNALGGERIYVGCFNPGIGFVITADRPVRLVVRIDK